jgi:alpha-beta hydrolase superfamily lysophospholipase
VRFSSLLKSDVPLPLFASPALKTICERFLSRKQTENNLAGVAGLLYRPAAGSQGGAMKHQAYSWRAGDGLELYAQSWAPEAKPKAVIALLHGLGDHSGRYPRFVEMLPAAGYAVAAYDMRGHGRSGGPRGHAVSYDTLMDDVDRHLAETGERFPGLPLILYGHSFGGAQALFYCLERRPTGIRAVVAGAPGLGAGTRQGAVKILMARVLSRTVPTLRIPLGSPMDSLSHDPAWLKTTEEDPLFEKTFSVRLGMEMLRANERVLGHTSFPLPLLVMQGTEDRHVDAQQNIAFAQRLSGDVTLKVWQGLGHELHNEVERDAVIRHMLQWLDAQVG